MHFHHFTELILKDILRSEHKLLADVAFRKAVILKKLLDGSQLTPEEENGVQSIEFSETLDRIVDLINADEITDSSSLRFICDSKPELKKLNTLRNRIWHRGTFILRYDALDRFFIQYLLPLLKEIINMGRYSNLTHQWKYKNLNCGFDPLDCLFQDSGNYNLGKVAFVKELGRAAYQNPLNGHGFFKIFDDEISNRAIAAAKSESHNTCDIKKCPVCGVESLVVYDEIEVEDENPETGEFQRMWRYTYEVKCYCCSFEINHHLKNGSEYGIPVEDYWSGEEM